MIPAAFVVVDALPMTPNGKVDRGALPAPDPENALHNDAEVLPRTPVEAALASIVKSLLKLDEIGIDDNFFLLGGHSLLGAQLIGRVREQFDVDIQLRALFESPTVASLASEVERLVLEKVSSMSDDDLRRLYGLSK
jgi:acyl carrier protein